MQCDFVRWTHVMQMHGASWMNRPILTSPNVIRCHVSHRTQIWSMAEMLVCVIAWPPDALGDGQQQLLALMVMAMVEP